MAPITTLYAGPLLLLLVVLAARVIARRRALRVGLGHGADRELELRIRVHGNAVETIPAGLLLLLLLELSGVGGIWLHLAGSGLLVGRILHAVGFSRHPGTSFGRFVGTALTLTVLGIGALALLARSAARLLG